MSKSQLKRLAIQKGDILDRLCTEWPAEWSLQPKTVDDRKCVIEIQRMKADAADEIKRLRHCVKGLTEQNAALIWELQGHGNGEPVPDILVQSAATTGENMILQSDIARLRQQRDELLEALEWLVSKEPDDSPKRGVLVARAAIAKCKEE